MAWRGKLRSAGRKHNEQGVLRRRRENRTRRQDALLEPGPSPVPRAILKGILPSPPHPRPSLPCQPARGSAWRVEGELDFSPHLSPQPGVLVQGTTFPASSTIPSRLCLSVAVRLSASPSSPRASVSSSDRHVLWGPSPLQLREQWGGAEPRPGYPPRAHGSVLRGAGGALVLPPGPQMRGPQGSCQ